MTKQFANEAFEVNFDGIVGLTHNYAGLSFGNVASLENKDSSSNPRQAALQGLKKMKFLADLGIKQGVLPPHERPHIPSLRRLGFQGSDLVVLEQAAKYNLDLLIATSSAAAMWTANAGTTSPSIDTHNGKVHFTPANLSAKFHRSIEAKTTSRILRAIFHDPTYFQHHAPLPAGNYFSDEGAANHTRFCQFYNQKGVHLFVYGREAFEENTKQTQKFPARQTKEASQAIARLHQLENSNVVYAQQNPEAIDAGVFHNDVISVGNRQLFFTHEKAFIDTNKVIQEIESKLGSQLSVVQVKEAEISLKEAVESYLFNSQIVTLPQGDTLFLAPLECKESENVCHYLHTLDKTLISRIEYLDLRESMRNGGGPACLRFRIVLNQTELAALSGNVMMNDALYAELTQWVIKHYRDRLTPQDLKDPSLLIEGREALDALTKILKIGSIYAFQMA